MKSLLLRTLSLLSFAGIPMVAYSQGSPNVQLLAHLDSYPSVGYNDCWGYTAPDGREYALLGVQNGTSIVDITDAPNNVSERAFISSPTSLWKDIKTYRNYAYVVNESSGGMQIIDLSNLPGSATLVGTYSGFSTSHNIYIDTTDAILYAEGTSAEPVRTISLADPLHPVQLSTFGIECHDIYARNNIAYVSEGYSGSIGIYDLNVPSSPSLLGRFSIPNPGYVHNAWLSEDNRYLMTTEETSGKTVKYWDISNLSNVTPKDEYAPSPYIAHNAHIKGNYAYLSYYTDGLRIVDITDPLNVVEVGYYDTYPGAGGGFDGAWGAFPFFATGKVLISDIETGLYVVFFPGGVEADSLDPNPPLDPHAYSDYHIPTSMTLSWMDPTTLFGGDPIQSGDFTIEILRDTMHVGSVLGGVQQFTDTGLMDGITYMYTLYAKLNANDSTSRSVATSWIAGGSPVPTPPTDISIQGNESQVMLRWRNPLENIDGTPMDDFAGIRLYQDGVPVTTFTRMSADSGRIDSATYNPSFPGRYVYSLSSIDNESPQHESSLSPALRVPLGLPVMDAFSTFGAPDSSLWLNTNADVNARASSPPSAPYSLNLNAHPIGGDTVDLLPLNLRGLESSNVVFSYSYQPQGTGNAPEIEDSLLVYFKNDQGAWVLVRGYPGTPLQPFQQEAITIGTAPNGGGTYFHSQFQIRFRSIGTESATTPFDDWFVDDVSLSILTDARNSDGIPERYALEQNYPNPFNPATTIAFALPEAGHITLTVYNILGQGVRTLVNRLMEAGSHRVRWDGFTESGSQVVSGVYFYKLRADRFTQTRKMILLK